MGDTSQPEPGPDLAAGVPASSVVDSRPLRGRFGDEPVLLVLTFAVVAASVSCAARSRPVITAGGLEVRIVAPGSGPQARSGQLVRIHETTTLADGTVIYTTRTENKPLKFLLGGNQVIAGVDEGVLGMRVGERRKLVVPPSLSRRSSYPANTPPDAVLHYDIELVEIIGNPPKS